MKRRATGFILILTLLMMTLFALLGTIQISQSLQASLRIKNALSRSVATQLADFAAQQGRQWLYYNASLAAGVPCASNASSCSTYYGSSLSAAPNSVDPTAVTWSGWAGSPKVRQASLGTGATAQFARYPNALAFYVIELVGKKTNGDANVWPSYRITGYGQTDTSNIAAKATSILNYTPSNDLSWSKNNFVTLTPVPRTNTNGRDTLNVMFRIIKDNEAGSQSRSDCTALRQDTRNGNAPTNNPDDSVDIADISMNSQYLFVDNRNNNNWATHRLLNAPNNDRLRGSDDVCPETAQVESGGYSYSGFAAICQVNALGQVRVGVYSNYDIYGNSNNYGGGYIAPNGSTADNYNSKHNTPCGWYFGSWSGTTAGSSSSLEVPTKYSESIWNGGTCTWTTTCPDGTNNTNHQCNYCNDNSYCSQQFGCQYAGQSQVSYQRSPCPQYCIGDITDCRWCCGSEGCGDWYSGPGYNPPNGNCSDSCYTSSPGTYGFIPDPTLGNNQNWQQCGAHKGTIMPTGGLYTGNGCGGASDYNKLCTTNCPSNNSNSCYAGITHCAGRGSGANGADCISPFVAPGGPFGGNGSCYDYSQSCGCRTPGCPGCVSPNYCNNGTQYGQYQFNNQCIDSSGNCYYPSSWPAKSAGSPKSFDTSVSGCSGYQYYQNGLSNGSITNNGYNCNSNSYGTYYTTYTFTCTINSATFTPPN